MPKDFYIFCTMPFTFGYPTADLNFKRAQRQISCSVAKCEWHSCELST